MKAQHLKGNFKVLFKLIPVIVYLTSLTGAKAQQDSIVDQIYAVLLLDSLTITADRSLPDIKFMIRQTIDDTTFYRAFQRLRRKNYRFSSEVYFYKPEWVPYTFLRSLRDQIIKDGLRTNEIIDEYAARHMKDQKGHYEFYTAQMYDRVFFTDTPAPVPDQWSDAVSESNSAQSRMDKYVHNLKLLLFAPGTPIDIPLMGNKTAIFTEDRMKFYDYSLRLDSTSYKSPAYVFTIVADPQHAKSETVIKEMETIFHAGSYQILGRTYRLAYKTLIYSFDVTMNIAIEKESGDYVPTRIEYNGWWKVPFKKPELCKFTFQITDFLN